MNLFHSNRNTESVVVFKSSPLLLKVMNFIISLFIIGSNIIGMQRGEYSVIAILVGVFCLAISTYQNIWKFDINKSIVCNRKGVLMFSKIVEYSFSEVSSLIIEKYNRAGRSSEYTEISIQFKDGEKVIIESDKTKRLEYEIEAVQRLQEIIAYAVC